MDPERLKNLKEKLKKDREKAYQIRLAKKQSLKEKKIWERQAKKNETKEIIKEDFVNSNYKDLASTNSNSKIINENMEKQEGSIDIGKSRSRVKELNNNKTEIKIKPKLDIISKVDNKLRTEKPGDSSSCFTIKVINLCRKRIGK